MQVMSTKVLRVFPFLGWFQNYSLQVFRLDIIAGLTVALVLVPQSMAYAQLAGLPPYYGLYAAFLPPLIAALFGSSRQLATGPVAVVSLMTATALEPLATAGGPEYIAYAVLLALLVGVFQLLLGILRLGLVVNFLSHPVVNGFTNAAAIIIASSQLSKLFGVHVDKAEHHYETIYNVVLAAISFTHWPTFALAVLAFAVMIVLRRVNRRIPNVLVAVAVTTIISWALGFEHNETVPVSRIVSEDARQAVQIFNTRMRELAAVSDKRVSLRSEYERLTDTAGERSVAVMELEHRINLLTVDMETLKEEIHESRTGIRSLLLVAVSDPDGELTFYDNEESIGTGHVHSRNWRIKVGNSPLDSEALTMTGGGAVVGTIPSGLPGLAVPKIEFSTVVSLFPMAMIISLLGFMEAISKNIFFPNLLRAFQAPFFLISSVLSVLQFL